MKCYILKNKLHIYIYIVQSNLVTQRKSPKRNSCTWITYAVLCGMGGVCVCVCLRVREHNYLLKDILRNANAHVHDQSHIQCFLKLQRDGAAGHCLHMESCH
jgi:hypothetical protein